MALSTDLISQFAKITKDEETSKKETTVYGTIVEYDGRKCVKFDGSELYTPVMMTVEAEAGERVTVLLKNHTATVTGNITSPAVRTETVRIIVDNVTDLQKYLDKMIDEEELNVERERIKALEEHIIIVDETLLKKLDSDVAANTYATKTTIDELNATISALEARIAALEGGVE